MAKNKLKQLLEQEGLAQAELAKASDISSGTINRICNQSYTPAPRTQNRIIKGLFKLTEKEFSVEEVF